MSHFNGAIAIDCCQAHQLVRGALREFGVHVRTPVCDFCLQICGQIARSDNIIL